MPDTNRLLDGPIPRTFIDENQFRDALANALDGATIQVGLEKHPRYQEKYTVTATTNKEQGVTRWKPDITVEHDIPLDAHPELTDPFFIECKIGEAFTQKKDVIDDFTDTGIAEFQDQALQLYIYKYEDEPVRYYTEATPGKQNQYRNNMPTGKHAVFLACPYALAREFLNNSRLGVCGEQFLKGQYKRGFGVLHRTASGKAAFQTSYHQYYEILETRI